MEGNTLEWGGGGEGQRRIKVCFSERWNEL